MPRAGSLSLVERRSRNASSRPYLHDVAVNDDEKKKEEKEKLVVAVVVVVVVVAVKVEAMIDRRRGGRR